MACISPHTERDQSSKLVPTHMQAPTQLPKFRLEIEIPRNRRVADVVEGRGGSACLDVERDK